MNKIIFFTFFIILHIPNVTAQREQEAASAEDNSTMHVPPPSTMACVGLNPGQEDRIDKDPDTMAGIPQASHQIQTDGIGVARGTGTNKKYTGSCATYTGFARFVAILKKEGLPIPNEFLINDVNIKRFYKNYGDEFGTGRGVPSIVTANILNEFIVKYCMSDSVKLLSELNSLGAPRFDACEKEVIQKCNYQKLTSYFEKYPESNQKERIIKKETIKYVSYRQRESIGKIFAGISRVFNTAKPRIPIELIYSGGGTHNTPEGASPALKSRTGHAALITGRRLTSNGECQILIRNSWKGNCIEGFYRRTKRECESDTDSTWVSESHLSRFVGQISIVN